MIGNDSKTVGRLKRRRRGADKFVAMNAGNVGSAALEPTYMDVLRA
jgi:hypothetical protein